MEIVLIIAALGVVIAAVTYFSSERENADTDKLTTLLLGNPNVKTWLDTHLTGNTTADFDAVCKEFGLGLREAKALLEKYQKR